MDSNNNTHKTKYAWFSFRCQRHKDEKTIEFLKQHSDVLIKIKIFEEPKSQNQKKRNIKIWPGNIFVKTKLEKGKVPQPTKEIIMETPFFLRFNSYKKGYYTDPILFSDRYIERLEKKITNKQKLTTGKFKPEDIDFEVNDIVSILSGVFRSYEGEVTEIDYDTGIITLNVEFFGRVTPIKVGFLDCKKNM